MNIDLADLADLTDAEVKLMALAANDLGSEPRVGTFWRSFALALVRAHRLRRVSAEALQDMADDEPVGAMVGPDDDPVADALAALRRGPFGGGMAEWS